MPLHLRLHVARITRLGHSVIGAHIHANNPADIVALGRRHDDRYVAFLTHVAQHVEAAYVRHDDIKVRCGTVSRPRTCNLRFAGQRWCLERSGIRSA